MKRSVLVVPLLCLAGLLAQAGHLSDSISCYIIQVIDRETMRGVPLVELKISSNLRYYTDSKGIICFREPSLMNQEVYFEIFSHGYKASRGVVMHTIPGTIDTIRIGRLNIAERLYRITGQDIYGESVKAGLPVPIQRQGLNGKVTGQDTFIETLYKGKIYWFWGDTGGPNSFNGKAAGALSELPGKGGLDPGVGIDLSYFVDSTGLNKPMCDIPGPGLVWIDWLVTLPDANGNERLVAKYTRTKDLAVAYERGIAVFDDSLQVFKSVQKIDQWLDKVHSSGHPVKIVSNHQAYQYIFDGYGLERVPTDYLKILDPGNYERFTCIKPGSKFSESKVERDRDGNLVYAWKTNTDPITTRQQYQLIDAGLLKENEGWFNPRNVLTGEKLMINPCSVFWNDYRKRWIMIAHEFAGQVWFLEADTPTGPWVYARKIVSHDNYDFYNEGQHPLFDQDGGRMIYFEGTYTTSFTGNPNKTPLYEYNQVMYRLTMDDERLVLPVPVYYLENYKDATPYMTRESIDALQLWQSVKKAAFFVLPAHRKVQGVIPVYQDRVNGKYKLSTSVKNQGKATPLFYALPNDPIRDEEISGTWECKANGIAFSMDISFKDNKVDVQPDDPFLIYENGMVQGDSIMLRIRDVLNKDTYQLSFRLYDGLLKGQIEWINEQEVGSITGKKINLFAGLFSSSDILPLYEYQKEDGAYYYATDPNLSGMKRSEQPVCRVWRNPTSILTLDYTAQPVPVKE